MADELTHAGEELTVKQGLEQNYDNGLYDDATDALDKDTIDPSTLTEPSGGSYARQSATPTAAKNGNWGVSYDVTFNVSDSSMDVDALFATVNFNSTEGGSESDWIIFGANLTQTRDLSQIDELDVNVDVVVQ